MAPSGWRAVYSSAGGFGSTCARPLSQQLPNSCQGMLLCCDLSRKALGLLALGLPAHARRNTSYCKWLLPCMSTSKCVRNCGHLPRNAGSRAELANVVARARCAIQPMPGPPY